MKFHLTKNKNKRAENKGTTLGMTLIEVMIYSVLLSVLLAGFIQYVWTTHFNDLKLNDDIENAYE